MGSVLSDGWIGDAEAIAVRDEASISEARELARARGAEVGLDATAIARTASAISELARNQLVHAGGGRIAVRPIARGGVAGLELIAADDGPGIADPTAAYRGGRTTGSLGVGLAAAHRQVDELDLDVRIGEGTCVRIRTFTAPVPRSEVAILSRPHPGEPLSGDHAALVRDDAGLTLAVLDGLGHGPLARAAADRGVAELAAHAARGERSPALLLADCNAALADTRGAVMAVARLATTRELHHAGVGNIASSLVGSDGVPHPLRSAAGVVGPGSFPRRVPVDQLALAAHQLLVMCSDGVTTRMTLADEPDLLREPAIVIAHAILARFGRINDDALVAIAR